MFLELCVNVGWHVSLMATFLVMRKVVNDHFLPLSTVTELSRCECCYDLQSLKYSSGFSQRKVTDPWAEESFPDSSTQWGRIWITPLVVIKIYRNLSVKVCVYVCTFTHTSMKVEWGTRGGVCVCVCACVYAHTLVRRWGGAPEVVLVC